MTLKVGSKYILRFKINEKELFYIATVIDDDGMIITFEDKYDKVYSYNKNLLLTAEEIEDSSKNLKDNLK